MGIYLSVVWREGRTRLNKKLLRRNLDEKENCKKMGCGVMPGYAAGPGGRVRQSETPAPAEDTIKLGFLGAKTVKNANYGIPGEKGMKMAIEEINAKGGVLGKSWKAYEDNKGDSREIANIATKYCTVDKVAAMIGDPATGLTKIAADIAQKNQVVIFSAGATGTGVVEIGILFSATPYWTNLPLLQWLTG